MTSSTRRASAALSLTLLAGTTLTGYAHAAPTASSPSASYTIIRDNPDAPGSILQATSIKSVTLAGHDLISAAPDGSVQLYGASLSPGEPVTLAAAVVAGKARLLGDVDALTEQDGMGVSTGEAGEGRIVRFDGVRTFSSYDPLTGTRTALAPFLHGGEEGMAMLTYTATRDGAVVATEIPNGEDAVRSVLWKVTASSVTRLAVVDGTITDIATTTGRVDVVVSPPLGSGNTTSLTAMTLTGAKLTPLRTVPGPRKGSSLESVSLGYARTGTTTTPMLAYSAWNDTSRVVDLTTGVTTTLAGEGALQVSTGVTRAPASVTNPLKVATRLSFRGATYPAKATVAYGTKVTPRATSSIPAGSTYSKSNAGWVRSRDADVDVITTRTNGTSVLTRYASDYELALSGTSHLAARMRTPSMYLKNTVTGATALQVRHHLKASLNKTRTAVTISSVTADKVSVQTRSSKGTWVTHRTVTLPAANTVTVTLPKGKSAVRVVAAATTSNATHSVTLARA